MLQVGDIVAVRGDKRWNYQKNCCCYFPEQLVDGKYVKNTWTGKVWTGKVTKITEDGRVYLGSSGSWNIDLIEKYEESK